MSAEPQAKKLKTDSDGLDVLQAAAEVGVGVADAAVAAGIEVQRRSDGKKYVGKGSLVEADLIRAKEEARSKNPDEMTSDEKKEERRIANRLSAFQSRQRRKKIIEDLHATVGKITKDNADQRKQTLQLTTKLDAARSENSLLRQQLAMLSTGLVQPTATDGSAPAAGEGAAPVGQEIMNFLNQLVTMQQPKADGAAAAPAVNLDQIVQGLQQQLQAAAPAAAAPASN